MKAAGISSAAIRCQRRSWQEDLAEPASRCMGPHLAALWQGDLAASYLNCCADTFIIKVLCEKGRHAAAQGAWGSCAGLKLAFYYYYYYYYGLELERV